MRAAPASPTASHTNIRHHIARQHRMTPPTCQPLFSARRSGPKGGSKAAIGPRERKRGGSPVRRFRPRYDSQPQTRRGQPGSKAPKPTRSSNTRRVAVARGEVKRGPVSDSTGTPVGRLWCGKKLERETRTSLCTTSPQGRQFFPVEGDVGGQAGGGRGWGCRCACPGAAWACAEDVHGHHLSMACQCWHPATDNRAGVGASHLPTSPSHAWT